MTTLMRRLPPLKALPAFELVASRGSINAAAEELHLTHGAVSRQIKSIEDYLGVPLFHRLNRRIELTPAGMAFLPAVRKTMQMLEASAARVAAQTVQGPLTVSCLATFMMRWLIPKLYAFSSAHPHIEVRLAASHTPARFVDEGIDLAIRIGKPPWPRRVVAHRMFPDRIGPVLAPALQKRHRLTRPGDLRKTVLLHTQTRAGAWSDWLQLMGLHAIDAVNGPHFEHTYFLLEAAASGLGVAIGSYPLVQEDLASGRLIAPFGFVESPNAYYLLHPKSTPNSQRIAAFAAWVMAEVQNAPSPAPDVRAHD
jgi:LysR family transcriptional regulator, glycine cleavage system transcriptional activator